MKHPLGFAITTHKPHRPRHHRREQRLPHDRQVLLTAKAALFRENLDRGSFDAGWDLSRLETEAVLR